MKSKKIKKTKSAKFDDHKWDTTDEEEIERRRHRAQTEKFKVLNSDSTQFYFSVFFVRSKNAKQYTVEIRSLTDYTNSCNCPDYENNRLGTCKHIEHVLYRHIKAGKKRYNQAALIGSSKIEVFFDTRDFTLRVVWPQKTNETARKLIDPFFSADGQLIDDPVFAYSQITHVFVASKKLFKKTCRLSSHIEPFIAYLTQQSEKKLAKEIFLRDVADGKKTFHITKQDLYPYQQEGLMHLAFNERALLADEMGLGKTVQAIAACELLRRYKNVKRVLIVATASLKAEWEEQIAKFSVLTSLIIQGSRANRLQQYRSSSFFYLTNYEQIISDGDDIQRLLSPDIIILDEAQRIKNWQTKTANAVKQLKSRYAFVLTGTPLENRIDDIYSIVQFLDPHIFGPLFRFNRDFYNIDGKGRPDGYKNLDALYQRIRPVILRRLKSDVEGQLPKRTINNYFIAMDKEQRIRYEEFENKLARLVAIAKSRPLRKEEFERMQRYLACMRMLCDTPFILDSTCRISPKIIELSKILKELLTDKNAKFIIFSEWERMLQLVRELAQKMHVEFAWHTGSVPQHKRRADINRFKNDPNCRFFLSTDSGSVGLNLQSANIVINCDLPWNPAKLEQRIARAWRKHQTRSVQVINLVCEHSIEHRMLGLLAQKQTLAEGVLEGKDNLKELALPSGRAAMIERMETLMGESHHTVEQPVSNTMPSEAMQSDESNKTSIQSNRDSIDLVQSHYPATEKSSLTLEQQLLDAIAQGSSVLEIIDRHLFETIQRLEKAGALTLNHPLEILHQSSDLIGLDKKIQAEKINCAKEQLAQAHKKHRMAEVLMRSDFFEESFSPLRDAFQSTVHAFSLLIGKTEKEFENKLSSDFIQDKLINQYGFHKNAALLFNQLSLENENPEQIKNLLSQYQEIYTHVDEKINGMTIN